MACQSDLLEVLLDSGEGDITVSFIDGFARAHSLILSARSPVLCAELRAPMVAQAKAINMDCCALTGKAFLRLIYSGRLGTEWLTCSATSGTLQVRKMAELADFYHIKGLDSACGKKLCKVLISLVKKELPHDSETFWDDMAKMISTLPGKVRRVLVGAYVWDTLTFGQDVFLALCISNARSCEDLRRQCLRKVNEVFHITWDRLQHHVDPDEGELNKDLVHRMDREFKEARLNEYIARTSSTVVLMSFVQFQSEVLDALPLRTVIPRQWYRNMNSRDYTTTEAQYFNVTQAVVLKQMSYISTVVGKFTSGCIQRTESECIGHHRSQWTS